MDSNIIINKIIKYEKTMLSQYPLEKSIRKEFHFLNLQYLRIFTISFLIILFNILFFFKNNEILGLDVSLGAYIVLNTVFFYHYIITSMSNNSFEKARFLFFISFSKKRIIFLELTGLIIVYDLIKIIRKKEDKSSLIIKEKENFINSLTKNQKISIVQNQENKYSGYVFYKYFSEEIISEVRKKNNRNKRSAFMGSHEYNSKIIDNYLLNYYNEKLREEESEGNLNNEWYK